MSSRLPDLVDPWHLADLEKTFSGKVGLADLTRLCTALASSEGEVAFKLTFGRDEKGRVRIEGSVQATLILECQRCLDDIQLPIESRLNLVVIETPTEANALPAECEPVQAEEGRIRLMDLVEDELLLSIPQAPMHERSQCSSALKDAVFLSGDPEQKNVTEKANPFAVLAKLKSD